VADNIEVKPLQVQAFAVVRRSMELFRTTVDAILASVDNENSSNSPDQEMSDEEIVASILRYAMNCLDRDEFFEALDDHFSPTDSSHELATCQGNRSVSTSMLRELGYEEASLDDVFEALKLQGGYCDCEILYNVAEERRLEAKYWQAQHTQLTARETHEPRQ
jgi:hypothetical protein